MRFKKIILTNGKLQIVYEMKFATIQISQITALTVFIQFISMKSLGIMNTTIIKNDNDETTESG